MFKCKNLKVYSVSNFAFLTRYWQDVYNREIVSSLKYLLIFCLTIIVTNQRNIKEICINSARFCSDDFYVWKFHLNSVMWYLHLPPTEPVLASIDFCCVFFAWNWYLLQTIAMQWLSVRLNYFAVLEFYSIRAIFQIPTEPSWIKFRHDLDKNIAQNPSLHHLPLF